MSAATLSPRQERAIARAAIDASRAALNQVLPTLRSPRGPSEISTLQLAASVLLNQAEKAWGPDDAPAAARRALTAASSAVMALAAVRYHQRVCAMTRKMTGQVRRAEGSLRTEALDACVCAEAAVRRWEVSLIGLEVRDA